MRKRRVYLILLGVVLASVVVAVCRREREPEYGGKKLSEWVYGAYLNPEVYPNDVEDAIRQIGTNAIPYLPKWIQYESPGWRIKLGRLLNPIIKRFKMTLEPKKVGRFVRAEAAAWALRRLGPEAERAIPELVRLMNEPNA